MYIMIPVAGVCMIYFIALKMLGIDTNEKPKTAEEEK